MDLAYPLALGLVLLALPVGWLARRKARGFTLPSAGAILGMRPSFRLRAARALPVLRVLAVVALAIAIAGPRRGDARTLIPGEGIDIALSLDISSSMNQRFGLGATWLEVTKQVITEFIAARENDRIGLVVFQRDALALAPPTLDYAALERMVEELESGLLPDGTGIGVGLAAALTMLQESTAASRVVILLTDGQHNATSISPEEAAQLAVALRIRVYTIGVVSDDAFSRSREIDEALLQAIADRTNGRYFVATNLEELSDVYTEIGSLERSRVGREVFDQYTELAPWFAGGAAALLLLDLVLRATVLRRAPA
jgi:Ca-activated chloride channel family protein